MSHLHKMRLAQVNDAVADLEKERTPEQTAKALTDAATITGEVAMVESSPELMRETLLKAAKNPKIPSRVPASVKKKKRK